MIRILHDQKHTLNHSGCKAFPISEHTVFEEHAFSKSSSRNHGCGCHHGRHQSGHQSRHPLPSPLLSWWAWRSCWSLLVPVATIVCQPSIYTTWTCSSHCSYCEHSDSVPSFPSLISLKIIETYWNSCSCLIIHGWFQPVWSLGRPERSWKQIELLAKPYSQALVPK